jgi:hypothetical protein
MPQPRFQLHDWGPTLVRPCAAKDAKTAASATSGQNTPDAYLVVILVLSNSSRGEKLRDRASHHVIAYLTVTWSEHTEVTSGL